MKGRSGICFPYIYLLSASQIMETGADTLLQHSCEKKHRQQNNNMSIPQYNRQLNEVLRLVHKTCMGIDQLQLIRITIERLY